MKKFELLEHGADYGVRGNGKTIEEAFQECAKGMFSIMVNDLKTVKKKECIPMIVTAKTKEDALVQWLNEILYHSHVKGLLFSEFKVECVEQIEHLWKVKAKACGEKMNPKKHEMPIEVKGASYTGLKVEQKRKQWIAQCVVDV